MLLLACVGALQGWATAAKYASLMLLNAMLSPDNLVVFMMFLKHAELPLHHHRRVISYGLLFAVVLRLTAMLAASSVLETFAPTQLLLAALVLTKGMQLLAEASCCFRQGVSEPDEPVPDATGHRAVQMLQRVVPVRWDTDSDGLWLARGGEETGDRLHVTRTTALIIAIGCSDIAFSSDSITAVLALSTDAFTLTFTMTLSILLLRCDYFLATSCLSKMDALDSALGVVLVLIGARLLLGQAGIEMPLWAIVGILGAWRVIVAAFFLMSSRKRGARGGVQKWSKDCRALDCSGEVLQQEMQPDVVAPPVDARTAPDGRARRVNVARQKTTLAGDASVLLSTSELAVFVEHIDIAPMAQEEGHDPFAGRTIAAVIGGVAGGASAVAVAFIVWRLRQKRKR